MPTYLDAGPANVEALNRLGQTISQARIGIGAQREQAREFDVRNALEQMYYELARQKAAAEAPHIAAQTAESVARTGAIPSEIGERLARTAQTTAQTSEIAPTAAASRLLTTNQASEANARAAQLMSAVDAQKVEIARAANIARLRTASQLPLPALSMMAQEPGGPSGPNPLIGALQSTDALPRGPGNVDPSLGMDPEMAKMLMDPAQVQQLVNAAVSGQTWGAASTSPAGTRELVAPVTAGPGHVVVDPATQRQIVKGPPQIGTTGMTPEQHFEIERMRQMGLWDRMTAETKAKFVADKFGDASPALFAAVDKMLKGSKPQYLRPPVNFGGPTSGGPRRIHISSPDGKQGGTINEGDVIPPGWRQD